MGMCLKALFLLLVGFALLNTSSVQADTLRLAPVGTLNFSSPRFNAGGGPIATSSTLGLGVGALADFPLLEAFRLETGLLYIKNIFSLSGAELTLNQLQIPVLVRFEPLPFISVGGGAYYSFGIGNVGVRTGNTTVDMSYSQLNYSSTDLGLVLSAALNLTIAPMSSLLIDLRYVYGLKNLSNLPNQTFRISSVLILVGVKFAI